MASRGYLWCVEHHHHDHHHAVPTKASTAFVVGIVLNLAFVVVEVVAGFAVHSLSLLSDAAHNLADVGTLALSLLAFRLLRVKPNSQYTYGYRKTSILVALFNAVVLLFSIGGIAFEAIHKTFDPPETLPGITIAVVAAVGILINGVTALFFFRERKKDINIRSAYLHLLSDALVSAGIVVGGVCMYYTGWFWMDNVLSLIIAGVILFSTWGLLRESLRLSLDGVPEEIRLEAIRKKVLAIPGVAGIHHIHVWAISSTENAMTAHLVLRDGTSRSEEQSIKSTLRHALEHEHIQHVTLETECEQGQCTEEVCAN
jgi:cobalt-zinc-cadmium efflux system protein